MKKQICLLLAGFLASFLLTGCQTGVTFSDITLNQRLPDDFRYRTLIKNSVSFRNDPASNIGLILTPDADGQYQIIGKPILSANSKPQVATLKDGEVYSSTVDSGASVQGNYLAFSAGLSATNAAKIDIVDAMHAYVPPAEIPDDQLFAVAATTSTSPRFWLEDLFISTVTTTYCSKEDANASASSPAFGAKASVYKQDSEAVHDWVVAARLINIDAYAKAHGKPANGPNPDPTTLVVAPSGPKLMNLPPSKRHLYTPRVGQNLTYAVLPPITVDFDNPK